METAPPRADTLIQHSRVKRTARTTEHSSGRKDRGGMASGDDQSVFTSRAAHQPEKTRTHLQQRDDLYRKNGNPAGLGTLPRSPRRRSGPVLSCLVPRPQPPFLIRSTCRHLTSPASLSDGTSVPLSHTRDTIKRVPHNKTKASLHAGNRQHTMIGLPLTRR